MSCACQLIDYTLATEEMSVIYQSAHVAITFQLLEMSSITTPNQIISNIFYGKILAILLIFILKKSNLEVPCKRNRFGYWNSCKRLPNFVNVAALLKIYAAINHQYIDIHLIKKEAEIISSFSILFLKNMVVTSKTCLKRPIKKKTKNWLSRPIIT